MTIFGHDDTAQGLVAELDALHRAGGSQVPTGKQAIAPGGKNVRAKAGDVEQPLAVVLDVSGAGRVVSVNPVQAAAHVAREDQAEFRQGAEGENAGLHRSHELADFRVVGIPLHHPAVASGGEDVPIRATRREGVEGGPMADGTVEAMDVQTSAKNKPRRVGLADTARFYENCVNEKGSVPGQKTLC